MTGQDVTWQEICVPMVARFESCAARKEDGLYHPYWDAMGKVWTRGYGRTYGISATSPGITLPEAQEELQTGLEAYCTHVLAASPSLGDKPQCLAACVSWAWNCGWQAFAVSRAKRAINAGQWHNAGMCLLTPNTARGVVIKDLTERRRIESALFLKGIG